LYLSKNNLAFLWRSYAWFLFQRMLWQVEFKADEEAAKEVVVEVLVSALKKLASFELDCDSPTHPSVNERIARLQKRLNP